MNPTDFIPQVSEIRRDPVNLSRFESIFAQQSVGLYELPKELLEEKAAAERIENELSNLPEINPAEAGEKLVADTVAAAIKGATLPDAGQLVTDVDKAEAVEVRRATLRSALDRFNFERARKLPGYVGRIISEYLRPALETLLDDARTLAPMLTEYGAEPDVSTMLDAPKKAQQAWRRFLELSARYDALRFGQSELEKVQPPQQDTNGRFREFRNGDELWPEMGVSTGPYGTESSWDSVPPWPTSTPAAKLLWIVRETNPIPDPWMPTSAERDARYSNFVAATA